MSIEHPTTETPAAQPPNAEPSQAVGKTANSSVEDQQTAETFSVSDQLGNLLIVGAVGLLVALALLVAFTQNTGEDPWPEPEPRIVEPWEEPDEPRVRDDDCDRDFRDAEERFARDCDDDRDGDRPGLFPND